jgi:nitrate/TMAO reductase-like tetraheme cytochrome c subunit
MDDSKRHLAQEREEIATRIANFRATQERFERERQEFFATTWQRIRAN